jgi:sugar (pentulose or hexulose) kinase
VEEPFIDPEGEIAAFCDSTGHYLPLLCVSNLANGYNEVLRLFDFGHEQFNAIVGRTRPGNDGRILLPWYVGERTPDLPQAAPVYFGFGLDDFNRERICRGVLEGHVLNLHAGFQRMPVDAKEIRLTGGLSRSEAWCQTIADIFEAEVIPVEGEGAALGAAVHAAWVWLGEDGRNISIGEAVSRFVQMDEKRRKRPAELDKEIYRRQKKLFDSLSRRIRGRAGEDPFQIRAEIMMLRER